LFAPRQAGPWGYHAAVDPRSHAVLLADDEPPLVRLMKRVLERAGYEVRVASDGVLALEAFEKDGDRIDVAVLDAAIVPRGCDEILDRIAAEHPAVGIVIASGDALETATRERMIACDGVFLRKPFAPEALLSAVEDSLVKEDA
jgi:DNA-binding NtrC family response regulator